MARKLPSLISGILVLSLATPALIQTVAQRSAGSPEALQELQSRMDAEAKAKESGDTAAVLNTSRRLAALTLLQLARIQMEQGASTEASDLLNESLSLEDRADTRAALSKASRGSGHGAPTERSAHNSDVGARKSKTAQRGMAEMQQIEAQYRELLGGTFNDMGTAEAREGQDQQALRHFQEAQRWDASLPGLQRNLGMAAFRAGNFAESARAFEALTQADPADTQSRLLLGMSLFSMDRFADASRAFAPIADAALKDPRSAYSMIYSLARSDQQARANELLDQVTTAPNIPADALNLFCQIYNTTDNYEHSASCFRRVLQAAPTTPRAHYQVGLALIRLDRPAEAVPELREEARLTPNDADVQYQLAYALLETSQKDEAMQLLRAVVTERPDHPEAQYELGKLLLEGGNVQEAIDHLEISARIDPSKDYIHYQLQSAYRRQGRTADAERELASYRAIKAKRRESPSASAH